MAGRLVTYVTQSGDNLQALARQFYDGRESAWTRIYDFNADLIGNNPNDLPPGLTLHIPTDEPVHPTQEGDTLQALAEQYTSDAQRWPLIYQANAWRYHDWTDPEQVPPGLLLHIPLQEFVYEWR